MHLADMSSLSPTARVILGLLAWNPRTGSSATGARRSAGSRPGRREVDAAGERRRAEPLQQARLAPDHERDREAAERRVRDGVADQAGDEVARDPPAVLDPVAVDRGEQDEEQRREEEDEDRGLAAAPRTSAARPAAGARRGSRRPPPRPARGRRPRASRGAPRAPRARSPRRARGRSARAARASARPSRARPPRRAAGSGSARRRCAVSSEGLPIRTISPSRSTATRSASCCASSR